MTGIPAEPLLTILSELGQQRTVLADTVLFHRGQRPATLFWVLEGELRLVRATSGGGSVVLQRCRRGPLAEASLFSPRYHCDGVAAVDTTLLAIGRDRFLAALGTPAFAGAYVQLLSGIVRELRSHAERLTLRRAPERIEHYLEEYGGFDCGAGEGTLKDWAAQLGLSHESLYRSLAAMEKRGRVVRESGRVRLADSE